MIFFIFLLELYGISHDEFLELASILILLNLFFITFLHTNIIKKHFLINSLVFSFLCEIFIYGSIKLNL